MSDSRKSTSQEPEPVPPGYWLTICSGREAVAAVVEATTDEEIRQVLNKYPVMMLPELPAAVEAAVRIPGVANLLRDCQARMCHDPDLYGRTLEDCARALTAERMGNRRINLHRSIELFHDAQTVYKEGPNFARCLKSEGDARMKLADLGVDARTNLEAAIDAYEQARAIYKEGPDFANCLLNEGATRRALARSGVDVQSNLEAAIRLYEQARAIYKDGPDFAKCLRNEGLARRSLADLGIDVHTNRKVAIGLFREAGDLLRESGYHSNARGAYRNLGQLFLSIGEAEQAKDAFDLAIQALEEVRTATISMLDRQSWMEDNIELFKEVVESCIRMERYDEAVEYIERGRSRALVDILAIETLGPYHVSPERAESYLRLRRRAEELDVLFSQLFGRTADGPDQSDHEQHTSLLRQKIEIGQQLTTVEKELRSLDPDFSALAEPLSLDDIKNLASTLRSSLVMLWVGPDRGLACLVQPSGKSSHILLPDVTDAVIHEKCSRKVPIATTTCTANMPTTTTSCIVTRFSATLRVDVWLGGRSNTGWVDGHLPALPRGQCVYSGMDEPNGADARPNVRGGSAACP